MYHVSDFPKFHAVSEAQGWDTHADMNVLLNWPHGWHCCGVEYTDDGTVLEFSTTEFPTPEDVDEIETRLYNYGVM